MMECPAKSVLKDDERYPPGLVIFDIRGINCGGFAVSEYAETHHLGPGCPLPRPVHGAVQLPQAHQERWKSLGAVAGGSLHQLDTEPGPQRTDEPIEVRYAERLQGGLEQQVIVHGEELNREVVVRAGRPCCKLKGRTQVGLFKIEGCDDQPAHLPVETSSPLGGQPIDPVVTFHQGSDSPEPAQRLLQVSPHQLLFERASLAGVEPVKDLAFEAGYVG
jgi:hypothetical protein